MVGATSANGGPSLRVGVIGTGFGSRVVARTFQGIGCEVTDVVSPRDPSAVAALCRSPLELISVHSPPFLHAEHVRWALEAGVAVLCDKPFGTSATQAGAMAREAAAAGVVNLVNFEFRHQPARQKMLELLSAGDVGQPEHFHYAASSSGSRVPLRPYGWLFDRARGGGWIGAFGSHVIDMIRWLLGEVVDAGARSWITVPTRPDRSGVLQDCDAEDAFSAWFELANGATASIDTTFTAAVSSPHRITLAGSAGVIENTGDVQVTLRRADGTRERFDFAPPPDDPHDVAMARWAAVVRDAVGAGRQISPSFDDGVACALVMDRLRVTLPVVAAHDGTPTSGAAAGEGHRA
jgi:predicted dehydrogenase